MLFHRRLTRYSYVHTQLLLIWYVLLDSELILYFNLFIFQQLSLPKEWETLFSLSLAMWAVLSYHQVNLTSSKLPITVNRRGGTPCVSDSLVNLHSSSICSHAGSSSRKPDVLISATFPCTNAFVYSLVLQPYVRHPLLSSRFHWLYIPMAYFVVITS